MDSFAKFSLLIETVCYLPPTHEGTEYAKDSYLNFFLMIMPDNMKAIFS